MGSLWGALALSGCSSQEGFVLNIRTPSGPNAQVRRYALQIQERKSRKIVYRSGLQSIDPQSDAPRDLAQTPFRLGLKITEPGEYFFHLLATAGTALDDKGPQLFFSDLVKSDGALAVEALLLPYQPGPGEDADDQDNDQFPDALRWPARLGADGARYQKRPELLDCVDRAPKVSSTVSEPPLPSNLTAPEINPLAQRRCVAPLMPGGAVDNIGAATLDVNCTNTPPTCIDADGDGDPAGIDCDDMDPQRYHGNPRPRNCCNCTDRASCQRDHSKRSDQSVCKGRCGDSFDYDCSGIIVDCFVDDDCDGYSPFDPQPSQRDCDDNDARVHPGAAKDCSDPSHDWACDGRPQAGCVPCDLDGDGFQRQDAMCPTKDYKLGKIDCDDDDRGVFPDSTSADAPTLIKHDLNGQEGGSVAAALRGLCRNRKPDLTTAQDADCDGDARKGCPPSTECDKDGDGYPVKNGNDAMGRACNPLNVELDCDDNDPQTFPGAPDRCGDGKRQNCRADTTCSNDADGDKYNADVDCDPNDPKVHPFAADACNGKDDDCDGLVDELNPDPSGARLVQTIGGKSQTSSCTDKNTGLCGQKSAAGFYTGRCVCTGQDPKTPHDADNNRVACRGTQDGEALSPKCFGAYQPQQQTCDADKPQDDDCDGRDDAPEGMNLKEAGNACGVTRGECVAGKVKGCDRSKVNAFHTLGVPGFAARDRFLVCDAAAKDPRQEVCNGRDDDCDGNLPGGPQSAMTVLLPGVNPKAPDGDEADHDADKRLACRNCNGQALANGLLGCDDCNDLDSAVYPSATELCDGKDNACKGAGYVDGSADCQGAGQACCAGTPMCVDTTKTFQYCGSCAKACDLKTADACVASECKCAADAACAGARPVCKSGAGCVQCLASADCGAVAGKPVCKQADNTCVECVANTDCNAGSGKPLCKAQGNLCVQCLVDSDCGAGKFCDGSNSCQTCNVDAHCGAACSVCTGTAAPRCLMGSSCVQCLGNADCANVAGKPNCDTVTHLCQECVSDANCPMGKYCAADKTCKACDVDLRCGAMCVACAGAQPRCSAALMCVQCLANGDCAGVSGKPACKAATNTCVECTADENCMNVAGKPACKVADNVCVECIADGNCTNAARPRCNVGANLCVACLADADCGSGKYCTAQNTCATCNTDAKCGAACTACMGGTPKCKNGMTCVECLTDGQCSGVTPKCSASNSCGCTSNTHCMNVAGKPACDTANKVCVECTADSHCAGVAGKPACDTAAKVCVPCINDSHCAAGQYCDANKTCKACDNADHCGSAACFICKDSAQPTCEANTRTCQCAANADCSAMETCDTTAGLCYRACAAATEAADCAADKTLTGTKCVRGMTDRCGCVNAATDCPAGFTCSNSVCTCGGTVCKVGQTCTNGKCT